MTTKNKIIISLSLIMAGVCVVLYFSRINIYEPVKIYLASENNNKSIAYHVTAETVLGNTISIKPDFHNEYWVDFGDFNNIKIFDTAAKSSNLGPKIRVFLIQTLTGERIYFSHKTVNGQFVITGTGDRSWLKILKCVIVQNRFFFSLLFVLIFIIGICALMAKLKIISLINTQIFDKLRYGLYAVVFLAGIYLRFSTPLTTILDPDSTGYLAPALKFLLFGEFDHYTRSYSYPFFNLITLLIFKDINTICIVQHILGLLSVLAMIIFIERSFMGHFINRNARILFTIISITFISTLILNGNIILFEKMLRPEGLILPSSIIILIFSYKYFKYKKTNHRLLLYGLNIFLLFTFIFLHPRMSAAFFSMAVVILIWEIRFRKTKLFIKIILPLGFFIFLFAACYIPEKYLINKYDQKASAFAYRQFFFTNAKTVLKAINEGISIESDFDNKVLKNDIIRTLKKDENNYMFPILHYNVDYLQYGLVEKEYIDYIHKLNWKSVFQKNKYLFGSNFPATRDDTLKIIKMIDHIIDNRYVHYYKSWSVILIEKYPIDVFKKALRQLIFVSFHPDIDFLRFGGNYSFGQSFQEKHIALYNYLVNKLNYKPDEKVNIKFPGYIAQFISILSIILRIGFVFCLFYFFIMLIKGQLSIFNFCITFIVIISIFTIAVFHTFEFVRYIASLSPLILSVMFFCSVDILTKNFKAKQYDKPL